MLFWNEVVGAYSCITGLAVNCFGILQINWREDAIGSITTMKGTLPIHDLVFPEPEKSFEDKVVERVKVVLDETFACSNLVFSEVTARMVYTQIKKIEEDLKREK